jgi:FkbM family methyltransferase
MTRLFGFFSLLKLAFLYLIRRDEWISYLCSFLSSKKVRRVEKVSLLEYMLNMQLGSMKTADSEVLDKSSDQQMVQVLELLKKISLRETQANKISGTSAVDLLEIYKKSADINFKPLHTTINRILAEQFSPGVIRQQGFAQEGEDLILARLMRQNNGFFIDVGAHHPTRFSNTYKLYRKGWRGINIDPLPGSMQLFSEIRAEDINLELAITSGDINTTVRYYMFDEPAYNSLDERNIADAEAGGASLIEEVEVASSSLSSILDDYGDSFSHIELLTIDVEHHELNVLHSFPFDEFQPNVIVIEIKGLDLANPGESQIYDYVIKQGYVLRSYLYHSAIFLRA